MKFHERSMERHQTLMKCASPMMCAMILMMCCPGIASAQTNASTRAASATENNGVISGRVVGDGGQPLANASVFAAPAAGKSKPSVAVTNDDGSFQLTGLGPAAYTLRASLSTYVMLPPVNPVTGQPLVFHHGDVATIYMVKGGVITGRVTSANDEPIPGLKIKAVRLRDETGRVVDGGSYSRRTDDRGIYRIFGLPPGTYVICSDGPDAGWSWDPDDQAHDAPTYHPASTRDTAIELTVQNGLELSGIDIRYRAERGHRVSGRIIGAATPGSGVTVSLKQAATGDELLSEWMNTENRVGEPVFTFELHGVTDGEYDLVAERYFEDDGALSAPHRVRVEGADVTGVELRMSPLATVAGTLVLEENKTANQDPSKKDACASGRKPFLEETVLTLMPDEPLPRQTALPAGFQNAFPSRTGEFAIKYLNAGRYHFAPQLPSEDWFLRAITLPSSANARTPVDLARVGLSLRAGERLKGVTITASTGAAGLKGKLQPAKDAKLPANVRVHLVPAEKDAADEVLRYAEVKASSDGAFAFTNLAPGKYWILTRTLDEATGKVPHPVAWDSAERAKLRREAEAANVVIELQACQRVKDYALKY